MGYIYSERARVCVNTEDIDHIRIIEVDNLPVHCFQDGVTQEDIDNNMFPYTILIVMKTKNDDGDDMISHFCYGYYTDDIGEVKKELQLLAAEIWGPRGRDKRPHYISYTDQGGR